MAVVKLTGPLTRASLASAAILALGGCSLYIDLDAIPSEDGIQFEDPNRSWFTSHCITVITVTRYGEGSSPSEVVWQAFRNSSDCLASTPFEYGVIEGSADRARYVAPQPLQPGSQYEIEVELSNGAGSGTFTLESDGTITNDG